MEAFKAEKERKRVEREARRLEWEKKQKIKERRRIYERTGVKLDLDVI